MRPWLRALVLAAAALALVPMALPCAAAEASGPLVIEFTDPGEVTALDKPVEVPVNLFNAGELPVSGVLKLSVGDGWRVEGEAAQEFLLPPQGEQTMPFSVRAGKGTFAAPYPVHARAEYHESPSKVAAAEAVLVLRVAAKAAARRRPAPLKWTGPRAASEAPAARAARRQAAVRAARAALTQAPGDWAWKLESSAGALGAAVAPGPNGLSDAVIAFADARRELVFDGFLVEVDGRALGPGSAGCAPLARSFGSGAGVLDCGLAPGPQGLTVRARLWAEKGALRLAFSMPGAPRDSRGEPRFTRLRLGPASQKALRVYAGLGRVLQDPGSFELPAGGGALSTRHVGADFAGGLSLVQACDVFPDSFIVEPRRWLYALSAHHDATFSLLPSALGAFAAARAYRGLAGFQPAGGVAGLQGRMCLDQGAGDTRRTAADLERAARYGLTDAVFVKRAWQRWGPQARLPDIYPPAGSLADFLAMVAACKRRGLLFAAQDNYSDFSPDAQGYSYDSIAFDADGAPQRSRPAQGTRPASYRWLPTAFAPWLERNLRDLKEGFAPDAAFVEKLADLAPADFYDRQGRWHPQSETVAAWAAAFDRMRAALGGKAPTISEGGVDALVGHLDAAQADPAAWPASAAADSEHVPWHDIASHGAFVLFTGSRDPRACGSDDALSLTVLGGRAPLCAGAFSRGAVMTYWLLHDLSGQLGRRELLAHEFVGNDLHRQAATFSARAFAWVNRGPADWLTDGKVLPQHGFTARAGDAEADVSRRDGLVTAFSSRPGAVFADARPDVSDEPAWVQPRVLGVKDLGRGRFKVQLQFRALRPLPPGTRPFVHFVDEKKKGEGVAFQVQWQLEPGALAAAGTSAAEVEAAWPAGLRPPAALALRCGFSAQGARLALAGPLDAFGRSRGGRILAAAGAGGRTQLRWQPEAPDPAWEARARRLNVARKVVDFGPVATDGAFRVSYGPDSVELVPLPSSEPFKITLRLDRLGAARRKALRVTALDDEGKPAAEAAFTQDQERLSFSHDGKAFAYRVVFWK